MHVGEAHCVQNNAGSDAQRVGGPSVKTLGVGNRVKLVDRSSGTAEDVAYIFRGDIAQLPKRILADAERLGILFADQANETPSNTEEGTDKTHCWKVVVSREKAGGSVIPILLGFEG